MFFTNSSVIKSVCVFLSVLFFILKAGEDDSLLEINKKMAGRVFIYFFAVPLFEFLPILSFSQLFQTFSLSICPQIGLNVTQICLSKECSEDEVSETNFVFPQLPHPHC